ncbi:MAG: zinc transporter ZupT [Planctomycetota bacterium]
MQGDFATAILLTTLAGLSTTVGSALAFVVRKPGPRFMAATLGFAAGVMVLVSFVELLPRAVETLEAAAGYAVFFGGMAAMWLVDVLIPHDYLAEHYKGGTSGNDAGASSAVGDEKNARLRRTGLLVALGLGIHNFPEGMATLGATLEDTRLGLAVAVAIAAHNVPQGLAVAVPVWAATGSRRKAFLWSFLSGLAEPAGAAVAFVALRAFLSPELLAGMLGLVAGFMVYVSLDELVPSSREYGHEHLSIAGVAAGMAVMAASLRLLGP